MGILHWSMHSSSWSHFLNRPWTSTRTSSIQASPILQRSWNKILASITNGATNPTSNRRAIQLKTTRFVTHRSPGTTTPQNEKQSPDESHCIPRTFSDPSSHLSWNSRMTSSPTWVLLEPHWVRHMPASLIIILASLVLSHACTWSSHPEIQLSTYILLVSSCTTGEVGYWDKWYLMISFNRNGRLLLPNGTQVNLITRGTPWSFQKNDVRHDLRDAPLPGGKPQQRLHTKQISNVWISSKYQANLGSNSGLSQDSHSVIHHCEPWQRRRKLDASWY